MAEYIEREAAIAEIENDYKNVEKIKTSLAQRWMVTAMYDPEVCYECQGYGDDWKEDENGELVSACDDCPFNGEDDYDL